MTSGETVRAAFPDARVAKARRKAEGASFVIRCGPEPDAEIVGRGGTKYQAWLNAARRLRAGDSGRPGG